MVVNDYRCAMSPLGVCRSPHIFLCIGRVKYVSFSRSNFYAAHIDFSTKNCHLSSDMGLKNITFRLMSEDDLEDVLAIEKMCYPLPWSARQFLDELQNNAAAILLCEVGGRIAGYICYWLIAGEMQILNVATAPGMRRKGIGQLLLQKAFSNCRQTGLSSAWLEVRAGNRGAIQLYQRNGFEQNGLRRGYYRDGEDAVLMVKKFDLDTEES